MLQTITADRVTSAEQEGSIRFSQLTTSTPPGHGRLMWVVAGRHTHARARVLTSSLKYSPIFCERDTCPPRRKKAGFPRHLITNQIITRLTTFFPPFSQQISHRSRIYVFICFELKKKQKWLKYTGKKEILTTE